jgi:peroxiredoxin family protein
MVTTNDETVPAFKELVELGVEILACGACLEFFDIVDELKTGKVTDAHTVATKLFKADKIVRL